MLGLSLKLPTLSRAVKPRNSELSYTRDSCRVKAVLATSCLMYSSHSSVRFTSTRAPNNSCLSRMEQCSALTKAGFLKVLSQIVESIPLEKRNMIGLFSPIASSHF